MMLPDSDPSADDALTAYADLQGFMEGELVLGLWQ